MSDKWLIYSELNITFKVFSEYILPLNVPFINCTFRINFPWLALHWTVLYIIIRQLKSIWLLIVEENSLG